MYEMKQAKALESVRRKLYLQYPRFMFVYFQVAVKIFVDGNGAHRVCKHLLVFRQIIYI